MASANSISHGHRFKDMLDKSFGCLVVVECAGKNKHGKILWKCLCDPSRGGCGNTSIVCGNHLRAGHTNSCGCKLSVSSRAANLTHGKTHTTEYRSWYAMKQRCTNLNHKSFDDYSGRGISICARWMNSFEDFLSDMGIKPSEKHTLERVDNNGNYEPGNCVWATRKTQNQNTRRTVFISHNGKTQCLSDWAREIGLTTGALCMRLKRGWPVSRALSVS